MKKAITGRLVMTAALLVGAACSDGPVAPGVGGLRVTIITSGGDQDTDGYRIVVDSAIVVNFPPHTTHVFKGLGAGSHTIAVDGIAANCLLDGPPVRSVLIEQNVIIDHTITVDCKETGILVTARTTGFDMPRNGFTVSAVGMDCCTSVNSEGIVPANGVASISRFQPGEYTVKLQVPENCVVSSGTSVPVSVANRMLIPVSFDVSCTLVDKTIVFVEDIQVSRFLSTPAIFAAASPTWSIYELARSGFDPAWSPDGSSLAYSDVYCDWYYGEPCTGGIVIINPDTRQTSAQISGGGGSQPAWRRDGRAIAFTRIAPNSHPRIFIAPLDGSPAVAIVTPALSAEDPTWSSDGQRLAFQCRVAEKYFADTREICITYIDGTGFQRLTPDFKWTGSPSWSPDGATIAFSTTQFTGTNEIVLINPDGTNLRRVTAGSGPTWSPDGSKLLFSTPEGLWTIDVEGSNRTRITTGRHRDPSWRP